MRGPAARHALTTAGVLALVVACGSSGNAPEAPAADAGPDAAAGNADAGDAGSAHPDGGSPITCSGTASYTHNGGKCGTERWAIKVGTDSQAPALRLVPHPTTIAALVALPAAGAGNSRESPTETTLWELKDVTMATLKLESDSDYHTVVSDGTHTMIVETPYPDCTTGGPFTCFVEHVRSEIDARFTVSTSPQYPSQTVTVRGFGFFDILHGQTGVAPNAIELHPVLQICFGKGCTPR